MTIAAIIPTLNEEGAIADVVRHVPGSIQDQDVHVYVIDGGSTDDTVARASEAGAEVIEQRYTGGKGAAMRQAFDTIDADVFVFLDGDGTYDASEMPDLVVPILDDEADHVIGTRMENREPGSIDMVNLVGQRCFNAIARFLFATDITDMLSGYRAISAELIEEMPVFADDFGIETELTLAGIETDRRVVETPITYRKRKAGRSKLKPLSAGYRILKTIIVAARDHRPIMFFSSIASVFLVGAVYPSYLVIEEKIRTGFVQHVTPAVLATLLFIFALQIFLFGMLADQQRNTQRRLQKLIMDS